MYSCSLVTNLLNILFENSTCTCKCSHIASPGEFVQNIFQGIMGPHGFIMINQELGLKK
jgi:hypothetical protein